MLPCHGSGCSASLRDGASRARCVDDLQGPVVPQTASVLRTGSSPPGPIASIHCMCFQMPLRPRFRGGAEHMYLPPCCRPPCVARDTCDLAQRMLKKMICVPMISTPELWKLSDNKASRPTWRQHFVLSPATWKADEAWQQLGSY